MILLIWFWFEQTERYQNRDEQVAYIVPFVPEKNAPFKSRDYVRKEINALYGLGAGVTPSM